MGAYAAFVWPAWGISALALAALVVRSVMAARRWKRELDRLEGANEALAGRRPADRAGRPGGAVRGLVPAPGPGLSA
ncbi:heme exporter protein CcmD [Brevundimonas denitrificans]|uniref:heme exporter protein CcmD n=1 Tax=Brevundimonas denitrificans TaxID=1443434 RepID=UPI0021E4B717|nr:heme exporter protein CcmD [Brevundimonas denitrificans]